MSLTNGATLKEGDRVQVTGRCLSIKGHPRLRRIRGVVGSVNPSNCDEPTLFKLWTDRPTDNGKLWFCINHCKIEYVH
jgi:hypothetical protein